MKYQDMTKEQQAQAREIWVEMELQDPAWWNEHNASMLAALDAFSNGMDSVIAQTFACCEATGYCADYILYELYDEHGDSLTESHILDAYQVAWEDEMDARCSDASLIEESILANDYDFTLKVCLA